MSKKDAQKTKRGPALSDDWRSFEKRAMQTGEVSFRTLIGLCDVWDIQTAAAPHWLLTGCTISYDSDCNFVAQVPDGPTILLAGDEPARPNLGMHERRMKDKRLAEIDRQMTECRDSAASAEEKIAELEAERRDLMG